MEAVNESRMDVSPNATRCQESRMDVSPNATRCQESRMDVSPNATRCRKSPMEMAPSAIFFLKNVADGMGSKGEVLPNMLADGCVSKCEVSEVADGNASKCEPVPGVADGSVSKRDRGFRFCTMSSVSNEDVPLWLRHRNGF